MSTPKRRLRPGKAREILEKLGASDQPERKVRTLSLNNALYERFATACSAKGLTPSRVVDELMAEFLEQTESKGSKT